METILFDLPDAESARGAPQAIEHGCDYLLEPDGAVMFYYNFFIYRWELPNEIVFARAYVDDMRKISVFVSNARLRADPLLEPIVCYLQQRFTEIDTFHADDTEITGTGYTPAYRLRGAAD
jgi:hypothetical protein